MATIKVYDRADEFRVDIVGRFAGECVADIAATWKEALRAAGSRRCVVNISRLVSYDAAGRKLLQEMYQHGTQIAAGTPLSLVFLNEISASPRRGPALVHEVPRKREDSKNAGPSARAMASGQ